jgi:hypothetical protein
VWWRALTGSDETLENAYLMAGRFSRRIRGYAKAHDIPVIDCSAGQRKHELAEENLAKTRVTQGLFLVLVGRAQAPVWDVSAKHHLERKKPMPNVNHYSFHILDPDRGHLTIKIRWHPPFPPQVILNGCGAAIWIGTASYPDCRATFKLHCGKLTLKIYTKGERVLRFEAVAHNTRELNCGRSLDKFPEVVSRLKNVLERFADAPSCIDQCFIADEMLEQLPTASRVGKTVIGGIDLNKAADAPGRRSADRLIPITQRLHCFRCRRSRPRTQ